MKKDSYIFLGLAAIAAYFLFFKKSATPATPANTNLQNLIAFENATGDSDAMKAQVIQQFKLMSTDEQNDSWNYIQLWQTGATIPDDLQSRIQAIAAKYNVFS